MNPPIQNKMGMDPDIWGPQFWFFLHTIAYNYPEHVNQVTKRKYYDFIQNLPLFIPVDKMGNNFAAILDKYPVSPYLDNRDSFIRWAHFVHNHYNRFLCKEEISLQESIELFLEKFRDKPVRLLEQTLQKRHIVYFSIILFMAFMIFLSYTKNS